MIVRRTILPLGLLAFISYHQVVAASTESDTSALNNSDGDTPCDLASDIQRCSTSRLTRSLASRSLSLANNLDERGDDPDPSECTCTNVFFNVWSACLISESDSAVPANNWTEKCNDAGFQIASGQVGDFNIPPWASAAMPPGEATFDFEGALSSADSEKDKWSKYQVITVVAIVCSLIGVVAIFIFLYRWKRIWSRQHGIAPSQHAWNLPRLPSGNSYFSRSSRRKIQQSDDDDFVIDRDVEELDGDYEFVGVNSGRSRSGHIRLPSSPALYLKSPSKPSIFQSLVPNLRRMVRNVPTPWVKRPVAVRALSADTIFDIDGPGGRHRSESTLQNYRNPFKTNYAPVAPPASSSHRSRSEPVIEEELPSDSDSEDEGPRRVPFAAGNERERLISNVYPSRNSADAGVMLISRSGNDFTMESGDTSSGHYNAQPTLQPPPSTNRAAVRPHPQPPPAPQYPAPLPPSPQYPAPVPPSPSHGTTRFRQVTNDNMDRHHRRMSSSPGRPAHNVRQPSHENMLGLSGVHYNHHNGSSTNTLPTAPTAPGSTPNLVDEPSPLYTRRPSREALRNQPSSQFRIQQTVPMERISGYSTDLEIPSISSPPYRSSPLHDERVLAGDGLRPLRSGEMLNVGYGEGEGLTPPPPMTPPTPGRRAHSRSVSREISPGRSDPRMLFPGPVRAAGYMRSPSQTRD